MLKALAAVMATSFVASEKPEEHCLLNRTKIARDSAGCVAHAGFEPAVSALRGRRPRPLDEWAVHPSARILPARARTVKLLHGMCYNAPRPQTPDRRLPLHPFNSGSLELNRVSGFFIGWGWVNQWIR